MMVDVIFTKKVLAGMINIHCHHEWTLRIRRPASLSPSLYHSRPPCLFAAWPPRLSPRAPAFGDETCQTTMPIPPHRTRAFDDAEISMGRFSGFNIARHAAVP